MTYAVGLMLVVVAGIFQAGFPLPMKYMKKWNWEISWSLYCVAGLFCLPWLAAYVRIPNLFEILGACTARELGVPIVYGMLWGVGLVFFGLGIASMGISLGNSIITGLGTPVGSLIPLIILHREKALEREGIYLFVGIFIMLFGVYYCGKAGETREMEKGELVKISGPRRYAWGIACCILSGVLCPAATLALAFGTPVTDRAVRMGVAATDATYLIWLLCIPAGSCISTLYCVYLMKKNKSWGQFTASGTGLYWLLLLAMCGIWLGALLVYGISTVYLGPLGVPIATALWTVFTILCGNAIGYFAGEWRGLKGVPLRQLVWGVALLTISSMVIGFGSR